MRNPMTLYAVVTLSIFATPALAQERSGTNVKASELYMQLDTSVITGLRSRDLVLIKEKIDNKDEHAIYLANAKDATGPVIALFDLKHRP